MTLVISTQYTMVRALPQELQEKVWKKHPVKLTKVERDAVGFDFVQSVMNLDRGQIPNRSPSALASIKAEDVVSDLLKVLDAAYRQSMEGYAISLLDATTNDLRTIAHNKERCIRMPEAVVSPVKKIQMSKVVQKVAPVFSKKEVKSFDDVKREAHSFRREWIKEVHTLETHRLAVIKASIETRIPKCRTLVASVKEDHPMRQKFVQEIDQLQRVYKAIFQYDYQG